MKNIWIKIALTAALVVFLVGCAPAESRQAGSSQSESAMPIETSGEEPMEIDNSMPQEDNSHATPSPGMETLIESAKHDLAQRLSIEMTQISLVEAKAVVWPDASLGCPQPGMKYKQVPEDGALIILQAQGTEYEYHNGGSRGLFLCEQVYKDPNPPPKIDLTDLTPRLQEDKNPPPLTPDQGIPPGEDQ